ncbi:LysR substrate-binding domain-containing protein [Streptomyces sp. NPDC003717]|uniref:LysR family transcriptional regulator n=1 Tax=Streptomyces sp. NPDC003717 TaxID=3154276 RepID=UPI0033A34F57
MRRTERRVGAPLFDRTTRRVRLTALGEQLRRELGAGYRQIRDGIETTARAASGDRGTLVLGLMGPHRWMMDDAVRLFRDRNPNTQVEFREIHPASPLDPLRAKTVDVALLWQPVREPDLTVGPCVLPRAAPDRETGEPCRRMRTGPVVHLARRAPRP